MSPNDYIMLRIANVKLDVAAYVSEKNTEKHLICKKLLSAAPFPAKKRKENALVNPL